MLELNKIYRSRNEILKKRMIFSKIVKVKKINKWSDYSIYMLKIQKYNKDKYYNNKIVEFIY